MTFSLSAADSAIQPPVAKIVPKTMTVLGDTRVDNYYWMRDRKDPETIKYLEAENDYTKAMMKHTDKLQSMLYSEMLGRIKQTDLTVPVKRDNFYYYTRTEEGKQYSIYCRKKGSLEAPEEVLLDGNALAEGKKYFRVGNFVVSPSHKLLAYSVDFAGDETYTIRVKDLATGKLLADEIPNTYYSLEWGTDNATFFYTVLDEAKAALQGLSPFAGREAGHARISRTRRALHSRALEDLERAYILININSSVTSEVRYVSAAQPKGKFQTILPRVQETEYDVTPSRRFVLHSHQRWRERLSGWWRRRSRIRRRRIGRN
jgi:oligopeptidase B